MLWLNLLEKVLALLDCSSGLINTPGQFASLTWLDECAQLVDLHLPSDYYIVPLLHEYAHSLDQFLFTFLSELIVKDIFELDHKWLRLLQYWNVGSVYWSEMGVGFGVRRRGQSRDWQVVLLCNVFEVVS
jgi:hypothetical protein